MVRANRKAPYRESERRAGLGKRKREKCPFEKTKRRMKTRWSFRHVHIHLQVHKTNSDIFSAVRTSDLLQINMRRPWT
jgi:hypothetical protein